MTLDSKALRREFYHWTNVAWNTLFINILYHTVVQHEQDLEFQRVAELPRTMNKQELIFKYYLPS